MRLRGIDGVTALIDGTQTFAVDSLVEKPDAATARRFIDEGRYYWNSGMFMLKASIYMDELRRYEPEIARQAELSLQNAKQDYDFVRLDAEAFAACPNISVDHAVMEKTQRAAVVAVADLGWNDIGSWTALADIAERDAQNNTLIGDVKKIVAQLNAMGRHESVTHRRVVQPWGSYEGIDSGERFQVKRIVVNPGAQLSLQMHHHRAEHWIVVKGTALVTNGDKEIMLTENQSTYIPLGVTHRLLNPGKIPLELIEVQSGAYLGEDDIVRFEDTYGRVAKV
ncbi:mannose-6-phosphate isomerase-like protein (cupin superfamily) [Paraburkholderia sp. Cpub6]|nr:mannose-6-phosphate isomerase-like protein (cupin superfamily) [Paraburkholderia sp. Cpub6]